MTIRKKLIKAPGPGLLILLFLIGCTSSALAQVLMPPPVQQNLGIPDIGFTTLVEDDCRFCHNQNPPPGIPVDPTYLPDRHHLLVGTPIVPSISVTLPNPDADGDGVPDTTYDCLNCHNIEWDPDLGSYVIVEDFRDCLNCHTNTPHHTTTEATTGDCQACHGSFVDRGLFDNDGDGIAETVNAPWIPTYQASLITPWPSQKDFKFCSTNLCQTGTCSETGESCTVDGDCPVSTTNLCVVDADCGVGQVCVDDGMLNGGEPARGRCTGPNNHGCTSDADCPVGETCDLDPIDLIYTGNCNYCHDSGVTPDDTSVLFNRRLHHNTGLTTIDGVSVCFWCHKGGAPFSTDPDKIRTCENCHGIPSLHNIQVDSDATGLVDTTGDGVGDTENAGTILPGAENPYWGHIGSNTGCNGCHGFSVTTASAPGSGPVVPNLDALSVSSVQAGVDTAITLTGKAFVNKIQNPMTGAFDITLASDVMLTDTASVQTILTPTLVTEDTIEVVIPATMAAGNYEIAARKASKVSSPLGLSVTPAVVIDVVTCDAGIATITGNGFGQYLDATDSGTSVTGQVTTVTETATIIFWTDTEIEAEFSTCPTCVTVDTVFNSATTCDGSPDPEVCDDGVDNDGDGKVDCADKGDCRKDPACKKPCKGKKC